MGIQDRDYMRRDKNDIRLDDENVTPSLRNLTFAKTGYYWYEKGLIALILLVIGLCLFQSHLSCRAINLAYDANKDGVITYRDIGFFINQLYYQPLLFLQQINQLNDFFIFLNIFKNNCLSFESIFLSAIIWFVLSVFAIKAILVLTYLCRYILHKTLFDIIKISPFTNFNKQIFRFIYPVKQFKFNTIFLLFLYIGLALVQVKLMLTSSPEVAKDRHNKLENQQIVKKNKQTDMVVGGGNYTNIYLNNFEELRKLNVRVTSITSDDTQNIYTLSKALTEGLTTDLEKIYVIYKWVTNNIEYDTVSFATGNFRGIGNANTVIQRRKAICDGYSELVMRLGLQAGLNVKKISGYAKGFGYQIGAPLNIPNHAWNSVQIDGKWYLLDATWDSGGVSSDTKQFFKNTGDYVFFLTNPQIFIYSHLPEHDEWQLTKSTWDKNEFFSKVNVTETAFKLGLNIEKQSNAVISAESLPFILDFESNVTLYGGLITGNKNINGNWTLLKYDTNGRAKLYISAPNNGSYILQLYATLQKNANYMTSFMQYKLNVNNSLNNFGVFPQTFPIYNSSKVVLESPLNGTLSSNQNTKFKLRVTGAKKIVLKQNQKNIELQLGDDGFFSADVKLDKGELMVFGDFNTPNQLDGIIKYQVN